MYAFKGNTKHRCMTRPTSTSSVPLLVLRRGISHCCVPGKLFALSSVPLQQNPLRESLRHLKCPQCDAR